MDVGGVKMKLQHILEARYDVSRPNTDWLSQEDWDNLSNDHKHFIASYYSLLTDLRDELTWKNSEWISYHGPEVEGWEFVEQAAETGAWDDLEDQCEQLRNAQSNEELEWFDPVFNIIENSVWNQDYSEAEKYYEEHKDDEDEW
jgi:hypothetical protein